MRLLEHPPDPLQRGNLKGGAYKHKNPSQNGEDMF